MSSRSRIGAAAVAALTVATLTGCSLDAVLWGPDGARVIDMTEALIDAATAEDAATVLCEGADVDFGEPEDWDGLAAGEPEKFRGDYWPRQVSLDPTWSINLELGGDRLDAGRVFPGDVFYREADGGLCLVDIEWSTIAAAAVPYETGA